MLAKRRGRLHLMMLAVAQLVATAFDDKSPSMSVRDYAG